MPGRQRRHQPLSSTQTETEEEARTRHVTLVACENADENADEGSNRRSRPRVTWTEDTVDNENLNRKKSKICCIYHPPDDECECSSEESEDSGSSTSSSSSSSDSESDSPVRAKSRPNAYERAPRLRRHVHSGNS